MPLTVHPHQVIYHRGLFKTTAGHLFKLLHSEAEFIKQTHASEKDHKLLQQFTQRELRTHSRSTVPQCHSVNFLNEDFL